MTNTTSPAPAAPAKGTEFTPAGCAGPWKVTSVRAGKVYGTPAAAYDGGSRTAIGSWALAEFAAMTEQPEVEAPAAEQVEVEQPAEQPAAYGFARSATPSPRLEGIIRRLSLRMVDVLVALHRGEGDRLPLSTATTLGALRDRQLIDAELQLTEDGQKAAAAILARDEQAEAFRAAQQPQQAPRPVVPVAAPAVEVDPADQLDDLEAKQRREGLTDAELTELQALRAWTTAGPAPVTELPSTTTTEVAAQMAAEVVAAVKAAGIPSAGAEWDGVHVYTIDPEKVVELVAIASRHGLRVDLAAGPAVYRLAP